MYALKRRCLLLKDKRMPRLPTDVCGKIYKDFDTYDASQSVAGQLKAWCESDLGLAPIDSKSAGAKSDRPEHLVYDGASDEAFSKWGRFDASHFAGNKFSLLRDTSGRSLGASRILELRAVATEFVGINLKVEVLQGAFIVEYKAVSSEAAALNLYFCVIPMKGSIKSLLEVGATNINEPENAYSPYRVRYFVPHQHIGDNTWHTARVEFDFRETPGTSYSICAVRINEGCPRPGAGVIQVWNVRIVTAGDA
jgi:hypothetical protein